MPPPPIPKIKLKIFRHKRRLPHQPAYQLHTRRPAPALAIRVPSRNRSFSRRSFRCSWIKRLHRHKSHTIFCCLQFRHVYQLRSHDYAITHSSASTYTYRAFTATNLNPPQDATLKPLPNLILLNPPKHRTHHASNLATTDATQGFKNKNGAAIAAPLQSQLNFSAFLCALSVSALSLLLFFSFNFELSTVNFPFFNP